MLVQILRSFMWEQYPDHMRVPMMAGKRYEVADDVAAGWINEDKAAAVETKDIVRAPENKTEDKGPKEDKGGQPQEAQETQKGGQGPQGGTKRR